MRISEHDLTTNGRTDTRLIPYQRAVRIRAENAERTAHAIIVRREAIRASLR